MRHALTLTLALLPLLLLGAVARFDGTMDADGIRFRFPRNTLQEPEETLEIFRYWRQQHGSTTKEELECFDPDQLWRHQQHKGAWKDKTGNTYQLVKATACKVPAANILQDGKQHVTRQEYDAAYPTTGLTDDTLSAWIEDWTDEPLQQRTPLKGTKNVRGAFCTTANHALLIAYLRTDPDHPYILIVNPKDEAPEKWKSVLSSALTSFTPYKTSATHATTKGGWYSIEKPPYRVHTNLTQKNRATLNKLLADIQAVRKAYTRVIPEPQGTQIPTSVIRIFPTHKAYVEHVSAIDPDLQWSAGLFSTTHRELLVSIEEDASAKDRKQRINTITFHEGWHQYLFLISPAGTDIPIWFNEGLATYFESFTVSGNTAKPQKNGDRARHALSLTHMHTVDGLKAFMTCSRDKFYDSQRLDYYAMAWAVTTTLLHDKNPLFKGTLKAFYDALCNGASADEAREKIFTDEVLEALSTALPKTIKKHLK